MTQSGKIDRNCNNVNNLEWSTVALNTQHGYNYSTYSNIRKVNKTQK